MTAASAALRTRDAVDVAAWLACGAGFTAPGPVERIDTHAASIFLNGERAWKLKRPVDLGYLDFSTPEKRRAALDAELRLNRRTAPDQYIAVHPISDDGRGGFVLDGDWPARDWVLEMRRFPDNALFSQALADGRVDEPALRGLADALVDFHRKAAIVDAPSGAERIRAVVEGNATTMARYPDLLSAERVQPLTHALMALIDRQALLLNIRRREGKVRHCHGDLHLANIALIDGRFVPFDCLEFDDDLASCDVLYDLAFLLMDLCEQGWSDAANLLFNRYLDRSAFDEDAVGLMPLFLAIRACVRAHVEAALARGEGKRSAAAARARRYLSFTEQVMLPPVPRLIAIGGLSGTGKSTLARALASQIGAAPGARILRNDVLRKRLAGMAPEVRLPPSSYTSDAALAVYREMERLAAAALAAGQSVIADATFMAGEERDRIAAVAGRMKAPFHGVWLQLDERERFVRIEARPSDASDADLGVARVQAKEDVGNLSPWGCLDAGGDFGTLRAAAMITLNLAPDCQAI